MVNLRERIDAELENIQQVLAQLPSVDQMDKLSTLELAGVAALLHNFYNGIENIIKQIFRDKKITIPQGPNWHRDLLDLAYTHKITNLATGKSLKQYLAFRHFFSHGYAYQLEVERILPLVKSSGKVFSSFKRAIKKVS